MVQPVAGCLLRAMGLGSASRQQPEIGFSPKSQEQALLIHGYISN